MPIINRIAEFHDDMTAWRRSLHAQPETAFEERLTADFVAGKLGGWGIEVHRGLAETGVSWARSTGITRKGARVGAGTGPLRRPRRHLGIRLAALKGDRRGQYGIRINDRWRICFVWRGGDAYDVEIVDYH